MDFGLHGVTQGGVDHALAREQVVPPEASRHHQRAEVSAAGAGMADMQRALVYDLEVVRRECLPQRQFDAIPAIDGHVLDKNPGQLGGRILARVYRADAGCHSRLGTALRT
jgi:hypothetical protein